MSMKVNMQDLIELLVSRYEMNAEEAEKFLVEFFSVIEQGLSSDELVKVKDFGTFKLTPIQERESIDVNSQEKIVIPSHHRVSFIPAQVLKTLVNKPFEHFETTPLNDDIFLENVELNNSSELSSDEDATIDDSGYENDSNIIEDGPIKSELSEVVTIQNKTTDLLEEASSHLDEIINSEDATKEKHKQVVIADDTSNNNPPPIYTKGIIKENVQPKRPFLWFYIAMAFFMITVVVLVYNFYFSTGNSTKQGVEESEIPKPIKEITPFVKDSIKTEPIISVDSIITVKMSPGRTLRLIALEKLGNREFWVYIYLKNKDKIKNPDVIPVGVELILPSKNEFDLDETNPVAISNAKKMGDEEMKKFW
ncbi:MAG: HU family DNA-binding protein [Candidatus Saccharimonadaceae bacterium]